MKANKLLFIVLALVAISLTGCKDKSAMLVKTWKVEDLKYSKQISPEMQESVNRTVADLKQSFRLTYNADGTYDTRMGPNTLNGHWKLNSNSTAITSTTSTGETKDYKIITLSDDKFEFEAEEGTGDRQEKVIFVMVPAK